MQPERRGMLGSHMTGQVGPRSVVITIMLLACCGPEATDRSRTVAPTPKQAVEERVAAIGDTSQLSPALQRAFDPADDFTPMRAPASNDWLAAHPEPPQTFAEFLDADTRVPGPLRRVIYLLPIGEFPPEAPAPRGFATERADQAFFARSATMRMPIGIR